MELDNSGGGLKRLHKTFAGSYIHRLQIHIQLVSKCGIYLIKIFLIKWRHKNIPIEGKSGHAFLQHSLSADNYITDIGSVEFA